MSAAAPHTVVDTARAFVGTPRPLAVGRRGGPLEGTTLAVKDVIDVAGVVTGAGNPTFAATRAVATENAEAVERLVTAGATVVGKTITDELAYSLSGTNVHFGTPLNSAAPDRIPGGSSAGSAAAVAAGLCDLALGTDTGGSIRVPASYCGIVGWRPTHGAVSAQGVVHLSRSFDTVGLLARSLTLLETAAAVLLGAAPASDSEAAALVPVLVSELLALASVEGQWSVRQCVGRLGGAAEQTVGVDLEAGAAAFRALQGHEAWAEHGDWILAVRPLMGPGIAERFRVAATVTAEAVEQAEIHREQVRRLVEAATAGGRVLIGPAATAAAPPLLATEQERATTRGRTLELTCLAGLAGAPVVVLPLAQADGLPLGVACMGAPGSDRALLRWAALRMAA